jgi:hypothetical protein
MELKCKVLRVGQTEVVSDKFKKRELIVEYAENPTYPQTLKFEASQDRCDKLDSVKSGDDINLSFNLKGREWTNKEGVVQVFNTLEVWKVDVISGGAPSGPVDDEPLF